MAAKKKPAKKVPGKKATTPRKGKPVLVTTEFRGVFFGYVKNQRKLPAEITLTGARCALYWSKDCKGFTGLAALGPKGDSRISARVPEMTLWKITSVTPVTPEAVAVWEQF